MDELTTTAERLRKLIEDKHITYTELERLSGVPKSAIQRYASGDTKKIPLDRIFAIADALGVSPYDVVGSDKPWGTDQQLGLEYARRDFADPAQQAREELADDPDRKALLDFARYGTAQEVRAVVSLIDTFRATNSDEYDGDDPA